MGRHNQKFGDVGTERCDNGTRKVMWISPGHVVILFTDVPEDSMRDYPLVPGKVTYPISTTKWLEILEND